MDNESVKIQTPAMTIFVAKHWLMRICTQEALQKHPDYTSEQIESKGKEIFQEISYGIIEERIPCRVFEDVKESCVTSDNTRLSKTIETLRCIQDTISTDTKNGVYGDVVVRLKIGMETSLLPYEIVCDGRVVFSGVDERDMQIAVTGILEGIKAAQYMTVDTPAGKLCAMSVAHDDAPAIGLFAIPEGHSCEVDLAYAEVKVNPAYRHNGESEKDIALYVYSDPSSDEWQQRIDFKYDAIQEALKEEE